MRKLSQIAKEGKIDNEASLTDRQSIIINAPIQKVWNHLVDIEKWPEWNPQIKKAYGDEKDPYSFTWNQHNRNFTSSFQYMKEPFGLSWTAKSGMVKAIYLWTLDPTDEEQTVVTVEQSFTGFLLFVFMNHRKMHDDLLNWLAQLKQVAEPASTLV